jgi:hypothetical protein
MEAIQFMENHSHKTSFLQCAILTMNATSWIKNWTTLDSCELGVSNIFLTSSQQTGRYASIYIDFPPEIIVGIHLHNSKFHSLAELFSPNAKSSLSTIA